MGTRAGCAGSSSGLVSEAASGRGGAGIGGLQGKTLFSQRPELVRFWQPRPNPRLEEAERTYTGRLGLAGETRTNAFYRQTAPGTTASGTAGRSEGK